MLEEKIIEFLKKEIIERKEKEGCIDSEEMKRLLQKAIDDFYECGVWYEKIPHKISRGFETGVNSVVELSKKNAIYLTDRAKLIEGRIKGYVCSVSKRILTRPEE